MAAAVSFISRSNTAAKEMGLDYKYVCQNYAAKGQDVLDGHGEAIKRRLIEISQK